MIVVPALLMLFKAFEMFGASDAGGSSHAITAVATSLATVMVTTGVTSIAQYRNHAIDWFVFRRWVAFMVMGSFGAAFIARMLDVTTIELFVGILMLAMAAKLIANWQPGNPRQWPHPLVSTSIAASIGTVSGLTGIGGANLVVPTLNYFSFPMVHAAATASALAFFVACFGTIGYAIAGWGQTSVGTLGYVYLPAAVPVAVGAALCAPFGVWLAHQLSSRRLQMIFGALLVVVAAQLVLGAVL